MDMKKILQALDTASSKPVEGSNDIKKSLSVISESSTPHKVSLPVQMAMNHYQEVKVEKPLTIKEVKKATLSSNLYQYLEVAERQVADEHAEKKSMLKEHARAIAQRVMELKKDTIKSYKAGATAQVKELEPHADSGEYKDLAKNAIARREKGIKTADKKLADPEYDNQNESQDPAEYDNEGQMAQQDLSTAEEAAEELRSILSSNENLPEWVQAKITKAVDYLDTARDYMKSVDESRMRNPDTMSPGDYDRHQQGQMDHGRREFKRQEMEHELGHETNNYAVSINGRTWKVFGSRSHAESVARKIQMKDPSKKIGVHETGAEISEGVK